MYKYLTAWLLVQNTASSLHPKRRFRWVEICVLLSSWEKCCCWWTCLIFPSLLFGCGHCGTKYSSQACGTNCAAVGLCCWEVRTFSGQMLLWAECPGTWAEWEDSWKTATYHRTFALQVHRSYLVIWNNIVDMEEIKDIFTQNDIGIWRSKVRSPFRRFLVVYTLVGGLKDLLSFRWHDNIHKVKESLQSLFCYSFKALFFSPWSRRIIWWLSYQTLGKWWFTTCQWLFQTCRRWVNLPKDL